LTNNQVKGCLGAGSAGSSNTPVHLSAQRRPLAVDEVQLGGDRLVRAVKMCVDESDERGRFLLTGSTNFLTVPTISESLAGRAAIMKPVEVPGSSWETSQTASDHGLELC